MPYRLGRKSLAVLLACCSSVLPLVACDDGPDDPPTGPSVPVTVSAMTVQPASAEIKVGGSIQLQLVGTIEQSVSPLLTLWESTDTLVARVSILGVVSGVGRGRATIRATQAGLSATASISVGIPE